jgi:hypothetical protein
MISSEPVSEALLPVYNQLQTLKRCLLEVKNQGGVSSARDLYPYSMKVSPPTDPSAIYKELSLLTIPALIAELDR